MRITTNFSHKMKFYRKNLSIKSSFLGATYCFSSLKTPKFYFKDICFSFKTTNKLSEITTLYQKKYIYCCPKSNKHTNLRKQDLNDLLLEILVRLIFRPLKVIRKRMCFYQSPLCMVIYISYQT